MPTDGDEDGREERPTTPASNDSQAKTLINAKHGAGAVGFWLMHVRAYDQPRNPLSVESYRAFKSLLHRYLNHIETW